MNTKYIFYHVTLKIEVMGAENSLFAITRINFILKYVKIEMAISNCNNI